MVTLHYILEQWHKLFAGLGERSYSLLLGLLLVAAIFLPLEWIFTLRSQKVLRKGFFRDIAYYFLNNLLNAFLLVVTTTLMVNRLHNYVPDALRHRMAALPVMPHLLLSLLVAEVGTYWGHRLMHEVPILWRFHAVHHSAEEMDWIVNTKAHPLDMTFTRTCGYILMYVTGLAEPMANQVDTVPLFIIRATELWGYFIHANVKWRFGCLEWLIATPAFHHWHHTNDGPKVVNKNYSALFPWVDKIFGSLYLPPVHPEKYGINEPMPESLIGQMVVPFVSKAESRTELAAEAGH